MRCFIFGMAGGLAAAVCFQLANLSVAQAAERLPKEWAPLLVSTATIIGALGAGFLAAVAGLRANERNVRERAREQARGLILDVIDRQREIELAASMKDWVGFGSAYAGLRAAVTKAATVAPAEVARLMAPLPEMLANFAQVKNRFELKEKDSPELAKEVKRVHEELQTAFNALATKCAETLKVNLHDD